MAILLDYYRNYLIFIVGGNSKMKQNMIYALRNDALVHISEVDSGLSCKCTCTACGEMLVAKKGTKVMHHFAHKSTIECEYGYQTSLHLAAKKIISESKKINLPALYLIFPETGKREFLIEEKEVQVLSVTLERKIDNIIPDILLETDIGKIIIEIFVTHQIDDEKMRRIKRVGISTIEINLSEFERDITDGDLKQILIADNQYKSWIYNEMREEVYQKFLRISERKEVIRRNYALHVDGCPIRKRMWKGNAYANFTYDCEECEYFIAYKKMRNDEEDKHEIWCSGKQLIAHLADFNIPYEQRVQEYNKKREEELYDLVGQGICPQCGYELVIRNGKYGEFFGCSNYPHCRFTFSYEEGEN